MVVQITKHSGVDPTLINSDIGLLCIVAHYAEKIRLVNSSRGAHGPQQLPQQNTNTQHPVGAKGMPSQTIHIPEELYEYTLSTKGDEQSTSKRVCELLQKGKEMEETHE